MLPVLASTRRRKTYIKKVLGIDRANLIGYWPMGELSGTNARNYEGTAARDGTYTGVSLNSSTGPDGKPVGLWDGTNDYCNVYSASLAGVFNGGAGTIISWIKVSAVGVWTDTTARGVLRIGVDAGNTLDLRKDGANNQLGWNYTANTTAVGVAKASVSSVGWIHIAMTWDQPADEMKAFYNGSQEGATQTSLGVWAGTPASNRMVVGALTPTPGNPWDGYLAHAAVWDVALTPAQILSLSKV